MPNVPSAAEYSGAPNTSVMDWLESGLIAPTSSGTLALGYMNSDPDDATITFAANSAGYGPYPSLALGAASNDTFSGTVIPGDPNNYLLGGGGGTLTLDGDNALGDQIVNASTNVTIEGNVVLAGANAYSGTTTVRAGATLQLGNAVRSPAGSSVFEVDGVLDLNGYNLTLTSLSGTGDVTNDDWSPATLTVNVPTSTTDTFDGLIEDGTGRLTFTLDGPGTFAFSQGAYSGDTIVSGGGTLQIGARSPATSNKAPPTPSCKRPAFWTPRPSKRATPSRCDPLRRGGRQRRDRPRRTLDLDGNNVEINGLRGGGTVTNSDSGQSVTLTVGDNDQTSEFDGTIDSTIGLTKVGTGTVTIPDYAGTPTVNEGEVVAGGWPRASQSAARPPRP